jgi:MFS family permease
MRSMLPPGADFRRLWIATGISVFGTWAAAITLSVRMFRDTGSPEWVSALFVAEFAPPVVIGVLFASRLDRLAPRRALVISDLVCAACFVVLAMVHQPAAVIALATVAGTAAGVFRPVALASVPVLVDEPELDAANGALTAIDTVMTTVGQAVSGILLTLIGAGAVLFANAVTFLFSAALLWGCRSLIVAAATGPLASVLGHIRRSFRTVMRAPSLLQVAVAAPLTLIMGGAINALEVPLFLGSLGASAAVVGIAIAVLQVGVLGGSLFAGSRGRTLGRLYPGILGLAGIFTIIAGLAGHLGVTIAAFFAFGITNGIVLVHNRSVLQRETPPAERAGTIALLMSLGAVAMVVGAIGGGMLAEEWSPRVVIAVAGLFGVFVVMPAALVTRPRA